MSELLAGEAYLGEDEILTISSSGSITDNTGLIEGETLSFLGGLVKFSLRPRTSDILTATPPRSSRPCSAACR